jgi:hypothetical protein
LKNARRGIHGQHERRILLPNQPGYCPIVRASEVLPERWTPITVRDKKPKKWWSSPSS